jgi:3-oxoacyl-[acyl-carrier protein] reductase
MRLKDNVTVITGAAQGIGEAYARRFVAEGARVALADINWDKVAGVAEDLRRSGADVIAVSVDVSSEESTKAMAATVVEKFGRIDTLISNAAIYHDIDNQNHSFEYLKKIFDVNYFGTWLSARACYPAMKKQSKGSIITQSSDAAYMRFGVPHEDLLPSYHYSVTKAAVNALTHFLAATCGPHGVRVNAISPGPTLTEATLKTVPRPMIDMLVQGLMAIKRPLEAEDLCGAAVFLASDESAMVTGQVLCVNGGLTMLG